MIVSVLHLKAVLQLEGVGRLVTLQPPGGGGGLGVRGGDRAEADGGVCSTGESGRERLRSLHPHLHLLQPPLLQPHSEGVLMHCVFVGGRPVRDHVLCVSGWWDLWWMA